MPHSLLTPSSTWCVLRRLRQDDYVRILRDAHQSAFDGVVNFHAIADDDPNWNRQVEFYFTEYGQPMTTIVMERVVELRCREAETEPMLPKRTDTDPNTDDVETVVYSQEEECLGAERAAPLRRKATAKCLDEVSESKHARINP